VLASAGLLDRSTPVPLHHQLTEALREQIASGQYRSGDLLPPETVLASEFGLSRATVRQGIATLVAEGLLSRRRGIGTTIARPDLEQPLHGLYTFADLAARSGLVLSTALLASREGRASPEAADRLHLRPDAATVELERLRLLDGVPLVLEEIVLPAGRCSVLLRDADLTEPLYELLERHCGILITSAQEGIRPVNLRSRGAGLLRQRRNAAAFQVDRIGVAGTEPVEWRRSLICGDRYLYSVELVRGQSAPGGRR